MAELVCIRPGHGPLTPWNKGLCGNKVRAIAVDKDNTVWMGTDKGISALSGNQWTTHNMKNGLSWNEQKAIGCDPRTNIRLGGRW